MRTTLTTVEVARLVGIDRVTLERWLARGHAAGAKVKKPKTVRIGDRDFRLWTQADVKRLKRFAADHKFEGRGRKPQK